jgi:Response receiver domain
MSSESAYAKFHDYSRGIVTKFLQTVVIVDDKAEINPEVKSDSAGASTSKSSDTTDGPVASAVSPGRGPLTRPAETEVGPPTNTDSSPLDVEEGENQNNTPVLSVTDESTSRQADDEVLPIKALNLAFAQYGIVCGFLSPLATGIDRDTIIQGAEKLAKRADIVILDWKMEGEDEGQTDGYTAKRIIKEILNGDEKGDSAFQSSGRLRLIVIYSQSIDLIAIIDEIEDTLNNKVSPRHSFKRKDYYTLVQDSTRICAFRKSGGTTDDGRTYNVKELTGKLINEFSILTEGLLSNVAIEALSALRLNTHKILQKFNPSLDAPYLTHRALTNPAEETQSHPIALLASEMHDVLEGNGITDSVSPELIRFWIESLPERITVSSDFTTIKAEDLLSFVANAVVNGVHKVSESMTANDQWNSFIKKMKDGKKDVASRFTNFMLSADDSTAPSKDRSFSMLTTVRTHYSVPPPYLTLGTIIAVRNERSSDYYICIQPVCDCVRLTCARRFPFLKLDFAPLPPKPAKFDIVIKDGETFLELVVNYKPYEMELFSFNPKSELIRAEKDEKSWIFKGVDATGKAIDYVWIADLKFAHAQRIAEQFGGQMSRVGLTESEWLRRMASDKKD